MSFEVRLSVMGLLPALRAPSVISLWLVGPPPPYSCYGYKKGVPPLPSLCKLVKERNIPAGFALPLLQRLANSSWVCLAAELATVPGTAGPRMVGT